MSVIVYGICMSDGVYLHVHVPPKVKPKEVHVDLRSTYMYMYTMTNHGTCTTRSLSLCLPLLTSCTKISVGPDYEPHCTSPAGISCLPI